MNIPTDTSPTVRPPWWKRASPGLSLIVLAPLVGEVLPGATRLSSIFVFPIEMVIWGGGAVIARDLVRRLNLSWVNLLLLALALAVAEECLIQQTSYAPLVVQIQGVEYGRAFGVNYVYLAWALIYESLFIVFVPVALTELLFPERRHEPWLNGWAYAVLAVLTVPASFAAWYGWNIVARPQVFNLPPYHLPLPLGLAGAAALALLVGAAIGPWRKSFTGRWRPLAPPSPVVAGLAAAIVVALLFGVELLAFGMFPNLIPLAAIALALLVAAACLIVPRWSADPAWRRAHVVALVIGLIVSNCLVLFAAFLDASPLDLYGKIVLDLVAFVGLIGVARLPAPTRGV